MNGSGYRCIAWVIAAVSLGRMGVVDGKNGQGVRYPDGREYKGPGASAGDGGESNLSKAQDEFLNKPHRAQPNADEVLKQASEKASEQAYEKAFAPPGGAGFHTFETGKLTAEEMAELNKHATIRREGGFTAYPDHDINAFNVGANLDLRARIAIDLLKSSYFHNSANVEYKPGEMGHMDADVAVHVACDVAESLIRHFEHKGWIGPVSRSGELSPELAKQAERMGRFGAAQQLSANQEAQDRANRVATLQQPGIVAGRA